MCVVCACIVCVCVCAPACVCSILLTHYNAHHHTWSCTSLNIRIGISIMLSCIRCSSFSTYPSKQLFSSKLLMLLSIDMRITASVIHNNSRYELFYSTVCVMLGININLAAFNIYMQSHVHTVRQDLRLQCCKHKHFQSTLLFKAKYSYAQKYLKNLTSIPA